MLQKLDTWRPEVVVLASRWDHYTESGLRGAVQLVDYYEKRGIKILLFEQEPRFGFGNFDADQYLSYIGASTFRLGEGLIKGDKALILSGRKALYRDEDHLSDWGTQVFQPQLVNTFRALLSSRSVRP